MRAAAYMYMHIGGGCTEPAELARKAAEQPAEWAAEGEGGQPRNTPGVNDRDDAIRHQADQYPIHQSAIKKTAHGWTLNKLKRTLIRKHKQPHQK